MLPKVLLIDDDPLYLQTASQQLGILGAEAVTALSVKAGVEAAVSGDPDAIFVDLQLQDGDGLELIKKLREAGCSQPIVMVSGTATIPDAVSALKLGASDVLVKPVKMRDLEAALHRALELARLGKENARLRELIREGAPDFIGASPAIRELKATADRVAASDVPILIQGETGVGKQVLARYIVARSGRSKEPFVTVNCAAIVTSLFESELFGHEKGAFTGAMARRSGKLELVGKGTLFLDEIGELTPQVQAKLLTALEDRTFERVGGGRPLAFEGRIIAATNRDLTSGISDGSFRRDLYYRLRGIELVIPPLRGRPDDIPLFIAHTIESSFHRLGKPLNLPSARIMAKLQQMSWTGNVRELIHHVERVALLTPTPDAPESLWIGDSTNVEATLSTTSDLHQAVEEFKNLHIDRVLKDSGGNQSTAAKKLGIGRTYLNQLLAKRNG